MVGRLHAMFLADMAHPERCWRDSHEA